MYPCCVCIPVWVRYNLGFHGRGHGASLLVTSCKVGLETQEDLDDDSGFFDLAHFGGKGNHVI